MLKRRLPIFTSLEILNSSLIFVIIAFAVDLLYVENKFNILFIEGRFSLFLSGLSRFELFQSILFIFISVIARLLIFPGIYGSLIELASGQELILAGKNFKKNIKDFWKVYVILFAISYLLHTYFIETFLKDLILTRFLISFVTDIIILSILAYVIIHRKYLRPLKLSSERIYVTVKQALFILVLGVANFAAVNIPLIIPLEKKAVVQVSILLSGYIHFLTFLYIANIMLERYPEIKNKYEPDKELFLINPSWVGWINGSASLFLRSYPPFFVVLKALTPKNYAIREFNRIVWRRRYYRPKKLVAISCYTSNSYKAYKIAREFRKHGSTVIMGGPHVTYNPEEALEYCDSVVTGEAESVWENLVKDYENNSLKKKYEGLPLDDYYKASHKELMNSPASIIKDYLETTRGCKFNCEFCSIPCLSKHKIRHKPVDEIVGLIKKIGGRHKKLLFIDNNIFADPAYAKELFKKLEPLKIKWVSSGGIDIAKDDEALTLAKKSGCTDLLIGYEIGPSSSEKDKGGKLSYAEEYIRLTKKIKKAGINIKAHFIFGFDSDSLRYVVGFWKFCFAINPLYTVFSFLTPLPGTKLYYRLLKENRINTLNWLYYDLSHSTFQHKRLNRFVMIIIFPLIRYFFLFTTSTFGRILVLLVALTVYLKW